MNAVILAAGYATRLYPLTENRPKALLEVGDRLLLDHLMDKLLAVEGLGKISLVTNHRFHDQFSEWAVRSKARARLSVFDDMTTSNDNRLGALGDLKFALDRMGKDEDLLVLASDNLFEGDLKAFASFAVKNGSAAVGVYDLGDPAKAARRYGVVDVAPGGRVRSIEEKPEHPKSALASMGVYFFGRSTLGRVDEYLSSRERQDAPGHYLIWILKREALWAHTFTGRWFDIGSLDQLEEAKRFYSRPRGV